MPNVVSLDQLATMLGGAPERAIFNSELALDLSAVDISTRMKREAPVATGELRDSIQVSSEFGKRTIGPKVPYAEYVVRGTKPHKITAKNKQALSFLVNGRRVFAKSVNHPGTKPNDFPKRAIEGYIQNLAQEVAKGGAKAVFGNG